MRVRHTGREMGPDNPWPDILEQHWFEHRVVRGNSVLRAIRYPAAITANDFLVDRLREIKFM
jgi:hypothetical protein